MVSCAANMLNSMVQQFDGQFGVKENLIQDQQSKLCERDKVIVNQKTDMERLEKKSKTLEYKVQQRSVATFFS